MWCEGPAWNGQGQYLIWSDIPNNRQMRWIEDDGRVTVFRQPSGNSNGNTFDHQGRQLSCEHSGRRVVRYEHDGSITVIADSFQGKRLNSPNDIACHHGRQLLVHRSPVRRTALRRDARCGGRSEQSAGTSEREGRAAGGIGRAEARAELQRLSRRSERPHRHGDQRGSARRHPERHYVFARLQAAVRRQSTAWCPCSTSSARASGGQAPRQFADFMVDGITLPHRRHPRRCLWKSLGQQQRRRECRLQRRHGLESSRAS